MSICIIPRNFKLLDEYEEMQSGKYSHISCGLMRDDDVTLTKWKGISISNNGDISSFTIICGEGYPHIPPIVTLIETKNDKIRSYFIHGKLGHKRGPLAKWNSRMGMSDILRFFTPL